jgi:hypothetical protein
MAKPPMDRIGMENVIDQKIGKQIEREVTQIDQLGRIAEEEKLAGGLAEDPTAKHEQHQAEIEKTLALFFGLYGEGEYEGCF